MDRLGYGTDWSRDGLRPEDEELHRLLRGYTRTDDRFNLARGDDVEDVLLIESSMEEYQRALVVKRDMAGIGVHALLSEQGIPVLTLLAESQRAPLVAFGVQSGMKPLYLEKLHDRPSTASYVGDKEIFAALGRVYGLAWRATGLLMLDVDDVGDNPLRHCAIKSQVDPGEPLVTLCPPYSGVEVPDGGGASVFFMHRLQGVFMARTVPAETALLLVRSSSQAFDGAIQG